MRAGNPATRCAGAAIVAALSLGELHAAKLPEWAQSIAGITEPVATGVPEYSSRVLLSEVEHTLEPDGSLRIRKRLAVQILSTASPEINYGFFRLEGTATRISARAWHLAPDGRAKRSWMSPVDFSVGDVFLSDMRIRAKYVPETRKGSLIFFEFEAVDKPHLLVLRHLFFEGTPVVVGRFILRTPPGWAVAWEWLQTQGSAPVKAGDLYTWEVREPALAREYPLASPPVDRAPALLVNAAPPAGTKPLVPIFGSWSDFSSWYEGLQEESLRPTPSILHAARQIEAGAEAGFFSKVGAAGRFVRDSVRYVAVELGIGGLRPRSAGETLSNLFGDCKDKAILFRALLSAAGLSSHSVLINLAHSDTVSERLPVFGFDHVVVAVPIPGGIDVPGVFSHAVMDGGEFGRLLIVDSTDEWTSIGSLSAALAGKRGLLVAGPRGRLITLPAPGPEAHRVERRLEFSLQPDRSVKMARVSTFSGAFAAGARREHGASSLNRKQDVDRGVHRLWPGATLMDYSVQPETRDATFVETVSARLGPIPAAGLGATFGVFPGAADEIQRVSLGRRDAPVVYGHPIGIRYDVVFNGVPETAVLPKPQELAGDGWSARTGFRQEGRVVTATWEVSLSRTRFTPEEFPELRKFWSAATSSAGAVLNLSR